MQPISVFAMLPVVPTSNGGDAVAVCGLGFKDGGRLDFFIEARSVDVVVSREPQLKKVEIPNSAGASRYRRRVQPRRGDSSARALSTTSASYPLIALSDQNPFSLVSGPAGTRRPIIGHACSSAGSSCKAELLWWGC